MSAAAGSLAHGRIDKNQILSAGLIIVALLIVAMLWFFLVHSVRIKELRYRLRTTNDQSGSVRTMSLVSRYRILRQAGRGDEALGYSREGRVMQILAETAYLAESEDFNVAEGAAKLSIDFFDLIAGSPPFKQDKNSRESRMLERAFYHEITRNYKDAVLGYDAALSAKRLTGDRRAYGMLHRGFCNALAGDRAKAITDFREVIATSSETEYVETAKALLAMMLEIDRELLQIDAMPTSTAKAAAYYGATAYAQAIDTLKKVPGAEGNTQALFYLGRSLEETGNTAAAVSEYRKLIALNPHAEVAVKANRRLFALGSFYAAGKEYRQESTKNVEKGVIDDKELLKEAARFEKVSERIEEGEKKAVAAFSASPIIPVAAIAPETPAAAPPLTPPAVAAKPVAVVPQPSAAPTTRAAVTPPETATPAPPTPAIPLATAETSDKVKKPEGIDWARLEKLPRAEKISYIAKQSKIESVMLDNGNQFRGLRISENKEKLHLFTALGRIVIIKSEIESRETTTP